MTNRLAFFICQELTKLTSLTSVAKVANVSVSTVIRIFNHVNYGTLTLPKVLCIDEFKGNAETGKYQCRELAKWIQHAESSGIPEFEKCAATYRRWHKEIKNHLHYILGLQIRAGPFHFLYRILWHHMTTCLMIHLVLLGQ